MVQYDMYRYLLTALILGFNCRDADAVSPQTWFQAQENCRNNGKRLTMNMNESHVYWTGRYRRISKWLKIIGCFNDSDVENQEVVIKDAMFDNPSAGLCQEFCAQSTSLLFAVKKRKCTCLTENFKGELINPSYCNYSCNSTRDEKFLTDCGGWSSYNVFSFENIGNNFAIYPGTHEPRECLSLQCGDIKYLMGSCNITIQPICQTQVDETSKTWLNSLQSCKTFGSYLLGNLSLTNASESCQNRSNKGPQWIGVAKQTYVGVDTGQIIGDEDRNSFQQCQKCGKVNCTFVSCSNSQGINKEHCSEISLTTKSYSTPILTQSTTTVMTTKQTTVAETNTYTKISLTTNSYSTPILTQSTTREMTTKQTTVAETTGNTHPSLKPDILNTTTHVAFVQKTPQSYIIIVPIVLVIVIIGTIAVAGVIYFRRRNNVQNSKDKNEQPERKRTNKTQTDINNPSYFVLEKPSSYEMADESVLDSESPYNETEEGEYDHLRNKDSRKKEKDDTYQHATSISNGIVSNYDYTTTNQRERDKKMEKSKKIILPELGEDSTYTEVDTVHQNTYFVLEKPSPYDLAANSTLDFDSPYNATEEGEYDHLRKKDSRKKIVDDTYQHTTPVINVDASLGHYGTTIAEKNQEIEGNYDHMHESLNFNRNSEK